MAKYDIPERPQPKRKYASGEKEVISIRAPSKLKARLQKIANEKGYSFAELVEVALDQFCQHEDGERK